MYAECHESPDGRPSCECPKRVDCPADLKPICGSDGQTYVNHCIMKVQACERRKNVTKTTDGTCGE